MKKHLLPVVALGIASTASAFNNPFIIPDAAIMGISPDNRTGVSQVLGSVFFFDLDNPTNPLYFSESEDGTVSYSVGNGNFVGLNTAAIGRLAEGQSVWKWNPSKGVANGRWYSLNQTPPPGGMGTPNGTVPDGSRICGSQGTGESFDSDTGASMILPCYWDVDGNSYTINMLPYPTEDYSGRPPMYITAISISDDGKTIAGQAMSNNGFLVEVLLYHQGEDGKWTMTSPFADLINPNNLVHPPYPEGEAPAEPAYESFLDDESLAAYHAALADYQNGIGEEPNVIKFMTVEAINAYNAYVDVVNAWKIKYNAWAETDLQILIDSSSFEYNSACLSPNGKYLACSSVNTYITPEGDQFSVYTPYLYDIESGSRMEIPSNKSVKITAVSDLGDLIGYSREYDVDYGFALPAGADAWLTLEDYVVERNPDLADWIQENWNHQVQVIIDEEEGIVEMQDVYITGMPVVSRDFSCLSTAAYVFWIDGPEEYYGRYCSWVVPLGGPRSAINELTDGASKADGDNAFYDLQGRRHAAPSASGIYIHKGKKLVVK
ncbi:MAG: hypothetical protein K2I28_06910 [Muribaculaceae bacterium]|nr:hypothetical protein [Muribaculaceae bacterium]